ncbi:hypothetical protein DXG03_001072 [Asterophora parasitica]|uniref:Uncharacterized protein n=1 Tax=Asterophora parasitica TaxID=117018 RepID=A0A9P7KBS1_9AGAR|nr:hypothetical protein DXG03_001072 [Asterophora parasitica]
MLRRHFRLLNTVLLYGRQRHLHVRTRMATPTQPTAPNDRPPPQPVAPNQRLSVQPDGTVFVDLDFVEEALGLPGVDGDGWARFEFGQAIGPNKRYTVERKLGWGMYSSTWLARDNE